MKEQETAIIALSSFILCLESLKTIEDEQQLKGKKRRNSWVSYINSKRPTFGAYHPTMAQLEVSESQEWRNYMRMDRHLLLFCNLLRVIFRNMILGVGWLFHLVRD